MKSEIFFGKRGCEVEHRKFNRALLKHEFSSDPLQPDQMYNWTEACKNNAENPTSGNMSDDSSSTNFSKEAISTTSASWDDEHSCGNLYQNMPNNIKSCLPDNADFSLGDSKENLLEFDQHDALSQVEYQLAWLTIQYHALAESYSDSINRLRQAETDVNSLRKENFQLQATNMKFARLFGMRERHILDGKTHDGLLAEPSRQSLNNIELPLDAYSNSFYNDQLVMNSGANASRVLNGSLSHDPFSLLSKSNNGPPISNGLSVVSRQGQSKALKQGNKMKNITADIPENSPTSVLSFEDHRTDFNKKICSKPLPSSERNLNKSINKPLARHSAVLPKSISIRSTGFLNMKVDTNREGGLKLPLQNLQLSKPVVPILSPKRPHRLRLAATADTQATASTPGDVENLGNVEYDVYNQGMFKTELCNKWQDTGACPYGERCQFAHGIEELRPVIRHPRYKTELCRMVAAGEKCPYGHRCHFRHSLTTEEKTDLQD